MIDMEIETLKKVEEMGIDVALSEDGEIQNLEQTDVSLLIFLINFFSFFLISY